MDTAILPECMPVRRLHNYAYCPRLFYLQWVEGLFEGNADTAQGDLVHRRADRPGRLPEEFGLADNTVIRSLALSDEKLGLTGIIDCVEAGPDGLEIIDYKKGRALRNPDGSMEAKVNDRLQVAAYALLLRAAGHRVTGARIWYASDRRHVPVVVDETAEHEVRQVLLNARAVAAAGACPPPLIDDVRCLHCSAYPMCLPNESAWWSGLLDDPPQGKRPPRPDDDGGGLLIVQDPKARVGCRQGSIVVECAGQTATRQPLAQLDALHLYGAIQVSAQALHALMERGITIAWFSPTGRFIGTARGLDASGVDGRRGQYRLFHDPAFRAATVAEVVRAKIHNQRVLLMRNGSDLEQVTDRMAVLRNHCNDADDIDEIRGIEGAAAAVYFQHFAAMLGDDHCVFDFLARNRRPPRDPVNALLSFAYSLLAKELTGIISAVGLDPFLGFFHQPRFGRPALSLDLMEEFRPLIADSVVISLINRGEVGPGDFASTTRGTFLKEAGRKQFWRAWARRMDDLITHPEFGYRMSYRRMLEVQVRQVWRLCCGTADRYHGFTTR